MGTGSEKAEMCLEKLEDCKEDNLLYLDAQMTEWKDEKNNIHP